MATEILISFISGLESDHRVANQRLCQVLDTAIACVSEGNPTAEPTDQNYCPTLWATDSCWPPTRYNSTAQSLCNINIPQNTSNPEDHLVRLHCNATTQAWNERFEKDSCYDYLTKYAPLVQFEATTHVSLLNSSEFYDNDFLQASKFVGQEENAPQLAEKALYDTLQVFVTIGHSLSLSFLIVALILFLLLKRLYCTRVFIHMNLMMAFILRGIMWIFHLIAFSGSNLVDDELYKTTMYLATTVFSRYYSSDLATMQNWRAEWCMPNDTVRQYYIALKRREENEKMMWCRVYFVFFEYAVTASYYWLLVEGLYLALILRAKSPNKSQKFIMRSFIVLGWGLPWLSVIAAAVAKTLDPQEFNSCWWEENNTYYWLITKIPIIISLLINFVIFVLVVRVVGSKLRVNLRHHADMSADYRWRLTKSTLALIPLLGIQYIITVFFDLYKIDISTFELVKATFETFLASIQGFLVALIYCFLNKEVRDELKRFWRTRKTEWELGAANKHKKQQNGAPSSFISSLNFLRRNNARSNKSCESGCTAEHSPQRIRYMSTMVTETSRLSTYSLKRGLYLQGAPSPMLNGPKIKETCLCGTFDKTSLKSENSFCGSGILNDKNKLLPNNNNNRLSLELNESLTKALSASAASDKLLSPSSACTATERHHCEQI